MIRSSVFSVAAALLLSAVAAVAATTGTVIDVRGRTAYIELGAGPAPRVGDLAEFTLDVGGAPVVVGTWRVTKISGPVVEAEPVNAQLAAARGMRVQIGGISAVAPAAAPPPPKPAPAPAPAKPQAQPAPAPAPAATAAAPAPLPGSVQFIKTARYERIWRDKGSGAHRDFAVWRPAAQNDYRPLGDAAVAGRAADGDRYPPPTEETFLVRNGVPPVTYRKVWSSDGSFSKKPFSSWMPLPPEGYRCLGEVASESLTEPPSLDAVRCVPAQCTIETSLGEEIWNDTGSGATQDFSAWRVPKVNTYIGNAAHGRPRGVFYTLSDSCL